MKKVILAAVLVAVAVSSSYINAAESIKVCSGLNGGFYYSIGERISKMLENQAKKYGVEVEHVESGGSVENATKLAEGGCDIAIVQGDVEIPMYDDAVGARVLSHSEYAMWVYGKDGVNDFGKMEQSSLKKDYVVATVRGGGAQRTAMNWTTTDEDYKGIVFQEFDSWDDAARVVATGKMTIGGVTKKVAGMIYVGKYGKLPQNVVSAYGAQLYMGDINDGDFRDFVINGEKVYVEADLPKKDVEGINSGSWNNVAFRIPAYLVYSGDYTSSISDSSVKRALRNAITNSMAAAAKLTSQ